MSYCAIAREMGRHQNTVKSRLDPIAAEHTRALQSQWAKKNPQKMRKATQSWLERNQARKKASDHRYKAQNKEKQKTQQREWYHRNIEHCKVKYREWVANNPEKAREKHRKRRTLRRTARRSALTPVTLEQISARRSLFGECCAYCGASCVLTLDHVHPLKAGGLDEASNIVPACMSCNSSKKAWPVEEWYRRQPFFSEARWRKIQRHCPAAVAGQLPLALAS